MKNRKKVVLVVESPPKPWTKELQGDLELSRFGVEVATDPRQVGVLIEGATAVVFTAVNHLGLALETARANPGVKVAVVLDRPQNFVALGQNCLNPGGLRSFLS